MKGARRLLRGSLLMLNKIQNTRLTDELTSYQLATEIEVYLKRTSPYKEKRKCKSCNH